MASAAVLFALVPFAVAGALLRGHPFDALYNHGLRHWLKSRRFPVYGVPRRFACAVASVWLITAAIAFAVGWTIAGTVLGCGMVLAAAVPVFTGFCIPSFLYGRLFGGRSARATGHRLTTIRNQPIGGDHERSVDPREHQRQPLCGLRPNTTSMA